MIENVPVLSGRTKYVRDIIFDLIIIIIVIVFIVITVTRFTIQPIYQLRTLTLIRTAITMIIIRSENDGSSIQERPTMTMKKEVSHRVNNPES